MMCSRSSVFEGGEAMKGESIFLTSYFLTDYLSLGTRLVALLDDY